MTNDFWFMEWDYFPRGRPVTNITVSEVFKIEINSLEKKKRVEHALPPGVAFSLLLGTSCWGNKTGCRSWYDNHSEGLCNQATNTGRSRPAPWHFKLNVFVHASPMCGCKSCPNTIIRDLNTDSFPFTSSFAQTPLRMQNTLCLTRFFTSRELHAVRVSAFHRGTHRLSNI
jgi:hypothetical protein